MLRWFTVKVLLLVVWMAGVGVSSRLSRFLGLMSLLAFREVDGWLPLLPEVDLLRLTGQMLVDVVQRKGATAGCFDGCGWLELKVLPVAWFDGLARTFSKVEDTGVWPEGLLDAFIVMIPKTDGDATPSGQRPLSVLPIAYRIWTSVRMGQLEDWFRSWVPNSVFSAGGSHFC